MLDVHKMDGGTAEAGASMKTTEVRRSGHPTFVGLPPEIRLAVYKHFFSGHPRLITYPCVRPFDLVEKRHWSLLLVSKHVYYEALPEYYRHCIFGLYELNNAHLEKLLRDMAHTQFTRHATSLLVWRIPEPSIFENLNHVKWVKLHGITCGIEPDPSNGQIFTYNSLMTALRKARVPGYSWARCKDMCSRHSKIDFMVGFRCDYPEVKLDVNGTPQRRWIKTDFVYDVRADTFVEHMRESYQQEALVLRPQTITKACDSPYDTSRAFLPP